MTAPWGNSFVAAGAVAVLEAKLAFQEWVTEKGGLVESASGPGQEQLPVPMLLSPSVLPAQLRGHRWSMESMKFARLSSAIPGFTPTSRRLRVSPTVGLKGF